MKNECDFIVKNGERIKDAIQVCWELNDGNREREFNGLLEAMNALELDTGHIITNSQQERIEIDKKIVKVVPAWRWLLTEY